MLPSKEDVANFLAFAPDAEEGIAFMFLEVRTVSKCLCIDLTDILKGRSKR